MNPDTRPIQCPPHSNTGSLKFTYPSGSQPLEGYTIRRGIGQGGFGEVYYATSKAGKDVAIKLLRRNLEVELRGVKQCLNLRHPNLVEVYDIKTDASDDRWVIMEYIAGESLADAIGRKPEGLSAKETLFWMRGLTAGVACLHDHGIVHRDLKPGNVFADQGFVKIGDYGLSKFISCSRRSGQTESIGTVHYMAPEIANGRYGREIDTYALGIILYEMLTGHVPFEGESVGEVLMKHLTAEPDLSQLAKPFEPIVRAALTKDPEQRIRSAIELFSLLSNMDRTTAPVAAPATPRPSKDQDGPPSHDPPRSSATSPVVLEATVIRDKPPRAGGWGTPIHLQKQGPCETPPSGTISWEIAVPALVILVAVSGVFFTSRSMRGVPLSTIGTFGLVCFLTIAGLGYWIASAVLRPAHRKQTIQERRLGHPTADPDTEVALEPPVQCDWRASWRSSQQPKTIQEKVAELTSSMLKSALVALTMAFLALLISGHVITERQLVWLALVGMLGSWIILIPAKVWEGNPGDQAPRRFVMLLAGLALGAMAHGLAHLMEVALPYTKNLFFRSPGAGLLSEQLYGPQGAPGLPVYMAYFGFLYLVVAWWRQADPGRHQRISLWTIGCCVLWAWLLNLFGTFPQPWGLELAVIFTIAVQLASPWRPPDNHRLSKTEGS